MSQNDAEEILEIARGLGIAAGAVTAIESATQEHARVMNWFESNFPITEWGRVDWAKVRGCLCSRWEDLSEASEQINLLVSQQGSTLGWSYILWSDATKPMIRVPETVLRAEMTPLLEVDWDTWILNPESRWCIEVYHEGEVCFGRRALVAI